MYGPTGLSNSSYCCAPRIRSRIDSPKENHFVLLPVWVQVAISARGSIEVNPTRGINIVHPRTPPDALGITGRAHQISRQGISNVYLQVAIAVWVPRLEALWEDFIWSAIVAAMAPAAAPARNRQPIPVAQTAATAAATATAALAMNFHGSSLIAAAVALAVSAIFLAAAFAVCLTHLLCHHR
jgi:hypothetical protein